MNLALSIPGSSIDFEKQKGLFHSDVNVLGIAYRENGSVAARFSDTVKLDYEKKEIKEFAKGSFRLPEHLQHCSGIIHAEAGAKRRRSRNSENMMPLWWSSLSPATALTLGGPALGESYAPVSQLTANMDAALLEERTPLVFKGLEFVPSASYNGLPKTINR